MAALLNVVLVIPLAGFLILLFLPRHDHGLIRVTALFFTLAAFAASLPLATAPATPGFQLETNFSWIDNPPIRYHIGIDGISLWLVLLVTFLMPISVLASWKHIETRVKEFFLFLLLLEVGMIGVFVALDLFLFYVFWEITLVPMYFLIGVWGHERRIYAAVKFFLYTMAGSVLMLAAILWLYNATGTFDFPRMQTLIANGPLTLGPAQELLLFLAFFIAFAIKVPLFPLHTWLPDAHVEAPTAGSILLAAVLLKMGAYGILRFCLTLFPQASRDLAPAVSILAIIGIIYGALVCLVQPNMKKLVAYSSVSHLGFVVLGIFSFTQLGADGAVYQMLNHGVSTGALFLLVGMMYERRHSLEISAYGGVATPAPVLATVFLITSLASAGLPMLNGFVGEFLVLQGTAEADFRYTVLAATGVILAAWYLLWLYQRVFLNETPQEVATHMSDLSGRELATIAALVVMMVWMACCPKFC
ncbi:MAG: NADH-quinone oxidoreductase subunit M [Acidobacteria bacterium]|nr:NADH-quinone oxidoreductase subunit M [Acidobacteriota bacterium]